MSSIELPWISVSAFNAVRFLFLSVILIPLFEAAIARIFRLLCALRLLRGQTADWQESNLGYLAMHGKYFSRTSRVFLYFISVAALAMYLLLEYGTSAVPYEIKAPLQIRKSIQLPATEFNRERLDFVLDQVDIGATLEFLQASLRLTGQRSVRFALNQNQSASSQESRPWSGTDVRNKSDLCFKKLSKYDFQKDNETKENEVIERAFGSSVSYSYYEKLIQSWYNVSSSHKAQYLLSNNSMFFEPGAEDRIVKFQVQLFSVQRDLRVLDEGALYHMQGTLHSADEFVKRFNSFGIRTTLVKTIEKTAALDGYVSFAANRFFKCIFQGGGHGEAKCWFSMPANSDGLYETRQILNGEKSWGPTCEVNANDTNEYSGKCLTLLLGGTVVSKSVYYDYRSDPNSTVFYIDVLMVDVLGSIEYEGRCITNEFGQFLTTRDAAVVSFVYGETKISLDAFRRLVMWPVVFFLHDRAFLRDQFQEEVLPVSFSVVPTISISFIAIVCAVALFIAVEAVCTIGLHSMYRSFNVFPRWFKSLVVAKHMNVYDSFRYAVKMTAATSNVCDYCGDAKVQQMHEDSQRNRNEMRLCLQRQSEQFFVSICKDQGEPWDGHSVID